MRPRSALSAVLACGLFAFVLSSATHGQGPRENRLVALLANDQVALGWFAPDRTAATARRAAADPRMDFIFMNMEQARSYNPADVDAFLQEMGAAGAKHPSDHPLMVRIPVFHDDPAAARQRVAEMVGLGVRAIVFPGMETEDEALQAIAAMKAVGALYPGDADGELASIFIIESEQGIANSRAITRVRPTVAIPGPGTLSRVYTRDMAKVEAAIQTQLASCKEFKVPCGITAGPKDVGRRIEEGFRVIIIYDRDYPQTIDVARAAAGRVAASANPLIELWSQGKPAFGVFVPDENPAPRERGMPRQAIYTREGGERLARQELIDYVFLNLEGEYDPAAIKAIVEGLRSPQAVSRKALVVRIPPIGRDGPDAAKARIREALDLGADCVTIPHVRSVEEAQQAISFFHAAQANVWSPTNPKGDKLAMLMIEDPRALSQAGQIADLKGYSILACGIGSLTQALGGDREAAEAGTQKVLAETKRVGLVNMLTATTRDVERRVKEGFLALLVQGPNADEAIRIGRAAAGR